MPPKGSQNQPLTNPKVVQESLTNFNKKLSEINVNNQKELQVLNQKILKLEQKSVNYLEKLFEPTSVFPAFFTIVTTLLITLIVNWNNKRNLQNDTKKIILYFIESNKNTLMALSLEIENLRPHPIVTNSVLYTKQIQSCEEFIKLLENNQVNKEVLPNSKIFQKENCNKILRYFIDLQNLLTNIRLMILRDFHKDPNDDYRLFRQDTYLYSEEVEMKKKLNSLLYSESIISNSESIISNIDFLYSQELYNEIAYEKVRQREQAKLHKLSKLVDDIREQLSAIICLSFEIMLVFDSKKMKNDDSFSKQIKVFWNGGELGGKYYPSAGKYQDDYPKLKAYVETMEIENKAA